ncbi:hypothetical protein GOBAR_AA08078 [Gossypium barbadense]|uniref:Uncharacterized protein n=1 Tax=Gossypium barbadense TaxID=3634 RepID=A0A2P5YAD9_GOSBA|nr:hypothetical protein GOBAR_AA08078 [Gossypium barbadense]
MERISMGTSITRRAKWQYPPAQPTPRILHLPRRPRRKAPKPGPSKQPTWQKDRKGVLERFFDQERSFASGAVPGRKNICEGKDVNLVLLEEQINDLVEKIEKLQKRTGVKELEVKKCSNFDKHVCLLQRQLQKFGFGGLSDEEICVKEIREMAEASLSIKISNEGSGSFASTSHHHNRNVESLRRKMDGLLESMEEEYGSLLFTSNLSSSSSLQQSNKEEKIGHEPRVCSGHCKAIVERVVEQIRGETEQWSQMQDMLGLVRDEMEELHASRDFWEDRALDSENQIQSLQSAVKEWRQRAMSSEAKAEELETQIYVLRQEMERLRQGRDRKSVRPQIASPINQLEAQNETEKRVLVCRLKEDDPNPKDGRRKPQTCRRSPLTDIGNISTLKKQQQSGEATLPLFSLHKEEMKRSL